MLSGYRKMQSVIGPVPRVLARMLKTEWPRILACSTRHFQYQQFFCSFCMRSNDRCKGSCTMAPPGDPGNGLQSNHTHRDASLLALLLVGLGLVLPFGLSCILTMCVCVCVDEYYQAPLLRSLHCEAFSSFFDDLSSHEVDRKRNGCLQEWRNQ